MKKYNLDNNHPSQLFTENIKLKNGDRVGIRSKDVSKIYEVTSIIGSQKNGWRACFKFQGKLPLGKLTWSLLPSIKVFLDNETDQRLIEYARKRNLRRDRLTAIKNLLKAVESSQNTKPDS